MKKEKINHSEPFGCCHLWQQCEILGRCMLDEPMTGIASGQVIILLDPEDCAFKKRLSDSSELS